MAEKYWLIKSEPNQFSIKDLQNRPNQTVDWNSIRNYQARNFMRDEMQIGDSVLFYHSGKNPSVVGLAKVVTGSYPDHTAWTANHKYFDPKSTPKKPIWHMVDIQFETEFPRQVSLAELRKVKGLEDMMLLRRGCRLSIQPLTGNEFDIIVSLATRETAA